MKRLPIGISDYKELIDDGYYYIDKTDLVREIWEASAKVLLIPRPRRFGKTLNLSMLRYFFEKTEESTSHLFANKAVWQNEQIRSLQSKYPVVFLTFKDIKESSWEQAYQKLCNVIAAEFGRHAYLLDTSMALHEKERFGRILNGAGNYADYSTSLHFLTKLLQEHYNQRVIVLLDEYDAPIHAAYNENYYKEAVDFLRSLMTAVFKDNSYLERGVITGILRTAKEGIFSGLNNLNVYTVLRDALSDKFGFTQSEVTTFLKDQKLSDLSQKIQAWYNGYQFGSTTIYNPWSMIKCADERGLLQPYWVNTSDNKIIQKLIIRATIPVKTELEQLLNPHATTLIKDINEAFIFPGIENNPTALWSLLLFSGYLTYSHKELTDDGKYQCTLIIPNAEIYSLYKDMITSVFEQAIQSATTTTMLQALTTGNTQTFAPLLQEFILNSISFYDIPETESERSYHLFVLGLLVCLQDSYILKSNRESGYGRYDIMLIPKEKSKKGIILEFKKVDTQSHESLQEAADRALEQIIEKKYAAELHQQGIADTVLYGIAVQGKKVLVKMASITA